MYKNGRRIYEFSKIEPIGNKSDEKLGINVDKNEVNFCLNCKKTKCSGKCNEFREFVKENRKNGKREILHIG